MNTTLMNFQFTCVQEKAFFPPLDPEADAWFKTARRLEKQQGKKDIEYIAKLYRQAAAKGHFKAMGNLQVMLATGETPPRPGKKRPEEVID